MKFVSSIYVMVLANQVSAHYYSFPRLTPVLPSSFVAADLGTKSNIIMENLGSWLHSDNSRQYTYRKIKYYEEGYPSVANIRKTRHLQMLTLPTLPQLPPLPTIPILPKKPLPKLPGISTIQNGLKSVKELGEANLRQVFENALKLLPKKELESPPTVKETDRENKKRTPDSFFGPEIRLFRGVSKNTKELVHTNSKIFEREWMKHVEECHKTPNGKIKELKDNAQKLEERNADDESIESPGVIFGNNDILNVALELMVYIRIARKERKQPDLIHDTINCLRELELHEVRTKKN